MGGLSDLFGGGAEKEARRARRAAEQAERERQDRIRRGREDINRIFGSTYTPEFFAGVEKNYVDWAMPQLNRQRDDVTRNLIYALARSGQSRSSAAARGKSDLQMDYDLQSQNVTKAGADLANNVRSNVENQRQGIEAQLYATADPAAASMAATNSALNSSFTPEYSPMGQLLVDVSGWYGMGQQNPGFVQQSAQYRGNRAPSSSGYRVGG